MELGDESLKGAAVKKVSPMQGKLKNSTNTKYIQILMSFISFPLLLIERMVSFCIRKYDPARGLFFCEPRRHCKSWIFPNPALFVKRGEACCLSRSLKACQ